MAIIKSILIFFKSTRAINVLSRYNKTKFHYIMKILETSLSVNSRMSDQISIGNSTEFLGQNYKRISVLKTKTF